MKQMRGIGVPTGFTCSLPGRAENVAEANRLSGWKKRLGQLSANRRELMFTAAATAGLGLVFLLLSYLFFAQLAAYGW